MVLIRGARSRGAVPQETHEHTRDEDSARASLDTASEICIYRQRTTGGSEVERLMNVLKWVGLLLFAQSFEYGQTGFGPSFSIGVNITPDRLIFIIILILGLFRLIRGEWQYVSLGKVGWYTLLLA